MARPVRIEYPGAIYHVTARGNERRPIYRDPDDRSLFLDVLGRTAARWGWICHAYCLMGNHYHLLLETPEGILARGMRQLNGEYTQAFNRRHRRCGHLLQGRYHAVLVEKGPHLLELCRYIVLNPVRARGMRVKGPGDWPWSSHRATAGRVPPPPFLHIGWVLEQFGEDVRRARRAYERFVAQGMTRRGAPAVRDGLWVGGEALAEPVRERVAAARDNPDYTRAQRFAARPTLDALLPPDIVSDLCRRNEAMARAYFEGRYTQKEIADHLGLHFTTVSAIVRARTPAARPILPRRLNS